MKGTFERSEDTLVKGRRRFAHCRRQSAEHLGALGGAASPPSGGLETKPPEHF